MRVKCQSEESAAHYVAENLKDLCSVERISKSNIWFMNTPALIDDLRKEIIFLCHELLVKNDMMNIGSTKNKSNESANAKPEPTTISDILKSLTEVLKSEMTNEQSEKEDEFFELLKKRYSAMDPLQREVMKKEILRKTDLDQ